MSPLPVLRRVDGGRTRATTERDGLTVTDLTIETTVLITLTNGQRLFQRFYLWIGLITMPLEVSSKPVELPSVAALDKGRFEYSVLGDFAGLSPPRGPDLEEFDALTRESKRDIQFFANVRRRPSLFYVRVYDFLVALQFYFAKRHDSVTAPPNVSDEPQAQVARLLLFALQKA